MTFSTENFLFLDAVAHPCEHRHQQVGLPFRHPHLASFPVIAGIEDAAFLFNVVFVITATEEEKDSNDFGIELPDELESKLTELTLTKEQLAGGSRLQDLQFPKGTLVMMVKREGSFIVPNGQMEMRAGDILLTIAHQNVQGDVP